MHKQKAGTYGSTESQELPFQIKRKARHCDGRKESALDFIIP